MIRAVIFDFNGVLVDDEHVHFSLFREVLAQEGIALSEAQYHARYLGLDDRGCFATALADAGQGVDGARVAALVARKGGRYVEVAETELRTFPGAAECLAAMSAQWPLAIFSGALRPEIEFGLRRLRSRDRITAIVSAEDTTRGKPDPEGYMLALGALRAGGAVVEPGECLVVEDSAAGVRAAKAAGMRAVGLAQTLAAEALAGAGADAVLPTLDRLTPQWIERQFPRIEDPSGSPADRAGRRAPSP